MLPLLKKGFKKLIICYIINFLQQKYYLFIFFTDMTNSLEHCMFISLDGAEANEVYFLLLLRPVLYCLKRNKVVFFACSNKVVQIRTMHLTEW